MNVIEYKTFGHFLKRDSLNSEADNLTVRKPVLFEFI